MSIKKDVFKSTGDYLKEVLQNYDAVANPNGILDPALNLKGLQWFDKQMGQFSNPQLALAIPLPCILMEYQTFQWTTIGKNHQKGNGSIKFYVYFENYADAFTGSVNQELALQFFLFTEQVNMALQGFTLPGMSPLQRITDNEDSAEDMIITSVVEYGTILVDKSAREARKYVMVEPDILVEKVDSTTRPVKPTFKDGYVIPTKKPLI